MAVENLEASERIAQAAAGTRGQITDREKLLVQTAYARGVADVKQLVHALAQSVDELSHQPGRDDGCHVGICEMEKCNNCSKHLRAQAVLRLAKGFLQG